MIRVTAAASLGLCALLARAETGDSIAPDVTAFDTGLLCNPLVIDQVEAPGTVAGTLNILEDVPGFTVQSRRVPAVVGISFGAIVSLSAPDLGYLDMTLTHPPMGALGTTVQSYMFRLSGFDDIPILYSLENEAELVIGTWTFEARHGGDLMMRFSFEVVAPQDLPELARLCGYEALLS